MKTMIDSSETDMILGKKMKQFFHGSYGNVTKLLMNRELGYPRGTSNLPLLRIAEEKAATSEMQETHCRVPPSVRATFLMSFSPDGTKVASTHGDHKIYICNVTTGKLLHRLEGHPRTPWCLEFHPTSNDIVASGCLAGEVRVWDLHGGSETWIAPQSTVITSLTFHPFDRVLVIATQNELYFWNWSEPKPFAVRSTNCNKEKVRYVKFDRLGNKLITGISNVTSLLNMAASERVSVRESAPNSFRRRNTARKSANSKFANSTSTTSATSSRPVAIGTLSRMQSVGLSPETESRHLAEGTSVQSTSIKSNALTVQSLLGENITVDNTKFNLNRKSSADSIGPSTSKGLSFVDKCKGVVRSSKSQSALGSNFTIRQGVAECDPASTSQSTSSINSEAAPEANCKGTLESNCAINLTPESHSTSTVQLDAVPEANLTISQGQNAATCTENLALTSPSTSAIQPTTESTCTFDQFLNLLVNPVASQSTSVIQSATTVKSISTAEPPGTSTQSTSSTAEPSATSFQTATTSQTRTTSTNRQSISMLAIKKFPPSLSAALTSPKAKKMKTDLNQADPQATATAQQTVSNAESASNVSQTSLSHADLMSNRRTLLNRIISMYQQMEQLQEMEHTQVPYRSQSPTDADALHQARQYARAATQASCLERVQPQLNQEVTINLNPQIPTTSQPQCNSNSMATKENKPNNSTLENSKDVDETLKTYNYLKTLCEALEEVLKAHHRHLALESALGRRVYAPVPRGTPVEYVSRHSVMEIVVETNDTPLTLVVRDNESSDGSTNGNAGAINQVATLGNLLGVLTRTQNSLQFSALTSPIAPEQIQQIRYRLTEILDCLANVSGYRADLTTMNRQYADGSSLQRNYESFSCYQPMDLSHSLWLVEMCLQLTKEMQRFHQAEKQLRMLKELVSSNVNADSSESPTHDIESQLVYSSSDNNCELQDANRNTCPISVDWRLISFHSQMNQRFLTQIHNSRHQIMQINREIAHFRDNFGSTDIQENQPSQDCDRPNLASNRNSAFRNYINENSSRRQIKPNERHNRQSVIARIDRGIDTNDGPHMCNSAFSPMKQKRLSVITQLNQASSASERLVLPRLDSDSRQERPSFVTIHPTESPLSRINTRTPKRLPGITTNPSVGPPDVTTHPTAGPSDEPTEISPNVTSQLTAAPSCVTTHSSIRIPDVTAYSAEIPPDVTAYSIRRPPVDMTDLRVRPPDGITDLSVRPTDLSIRPTDGMTDLSVRPIDGMTDLSVRPPDVTTDPSMRTPDVITHSTETQPDASARPGLTVNTLERPPDGNSHPLERPPTRPCLHSRLFDLCALCLDMPPAPESLQRQVLDLLSSRQESPFGTDSHVLDLHSSRQERSSFAPQRIPMINLDPPHEIARSHVRTLETNNVALQPNERSHTTNESNERRWRVRLRLDYPNDIPAVQAMTARLTRLRQWQTPAIERLIRPMLFLGTTNLERITSSFSREETTNSQEPTAASQEPATADRVSIATGQEPATADRVSIATGQEPPTSLQDPTTSLQDPTTTGRKREPTTSGQEPSSTTDREPSSTTDREPSSTTDREPSSTTSREPSSTTGREPSSTTGREPSSTTGRELSSTTGREPSSTTGREPSSATGREPSSTTGREPSSTTGREPSSTTAREPSSTTAQEPSATGQVPSTILQGPFAILGEPSTFLNEPISATVNPFATWPNPSSSRTDFLASRLIQSQNSEPLHNQWRLIRRRLELPHFETLLSERSVRPRLEDSHQGLPPHSESQFRPLLQVPRPRTIQPLTLSDDRQAQESRRTVQPQAAERTINLFLPSDSNRQQSRFFIPEVFVEASSDPVASELLPLPVNERPRSPPLSAILQGVDVLAGNMSSAYTAMVFDGGARLGFNDGGNGFTHRIQMWDFSKYDLPDISRVAHNVVVERCKIHNDASIDISKDGELLVALVPSRPNAIEPLVFGVFSLRKDNLGTCLCTWGFESNAISVSLSPLGQYVVVGLACSRPFVASHEKEAVAQIFKIKPVGSCFSTVHIRSLTQLNNNESRYPQVSLNSVQWLPEPGQGLIYGTNRGCLCICKPRAPMTLKKSQSFHQSSAMQSSGISLGFNNRARNRSSEVTTMSTQTNHPLTQTTGTQTFSSESSSVG